MLKITPHFYRHHLSAMLALSLLFSVVAVAIAADGENLYNQKCASCHGAAGASVIPTQPILSGQHAEYLAAQLRHFRDGQRKNPIMSPMAIGLSDADIDAIASYLSQQKPVIAGGSDADQAKQGELIYRLGVAEDAIPACTACHTPTGAGIAPHYPRLSGQYTQYTIDSLKAYRDGTRPSVEMNAIAAKLTDEQITQLAEYISGLAE